MLSLLRFNHRRPLLAVMVLMFFIVAAVDALKCGTGFNWNWFDKENKLYRYEFAGMGKYGEGECELHPEDNIQVPKCYTFVCYYEEDYYIAGAGCYDYLLKTCKVDEAQYGIFLASTPETVPEKGSGSFDNIIFHWCSEFNCYKKGDDSIVHEFRDIVAKNPSSKFGKYKFKELKFRGEHDDFDATTTPTPAIVPTENSTSVVNATTVASNDTDGNVTSPNRAPSQAFSGSIIIAAMVWLSVLFV